ncbi:DMT family transporter [Synechococcus sp. CBW1002]|uniref:DMT family transporter n=2 Tax=Synechococcus TaxID=1129 RepID=UPI0018CFBA52|nr:DMT family transporter [Synechococcus sp. CBW1002]QPN59880.1 DMT family transporter [Synechococcus sp. CBW1002]QPN66680.1 DMT family transporter [Synechococcus sp. CBW1006]CAK6692843.1 Riboflavin transporter [Synechococcus sp. CBW1107]
MAETTMGSLMLGSGLLVLAFLANTAQSAFGKALGSGMGAMQFTWLTFVIALGLILPWLLLRGGRDLRTTVLHLHVLRSCTGLAGFFLFITAARLVNLVNANVLLNTTPLFIPLLALLVLGQQVPRALWGCLAIGFAGMVIVVQPNASLLTRPGDLLGLAAGLLCAVEFLAVKRLDRSESPLTQMAYFLIIGSIGATLAVLGPLRPPGVGAALLSGIDPAQWATVVASGACLACFQFLLIKAYTYAEPGAIGAFQYSSVVFAGLIGWIWFAEQPTPPVWFGTALITLGGVLSIVLQRPAVSVHPAAGTES